MSRDVTAEVALGQPLSHTSITYRTFRLVAPIRCERIRQAPHCSRLEIRMLRILNRVRALSAPSVSGPQIAFDERHASPSMPQPLNISRLLRAPALGLSARDTAPVEVPN